MSAERLCQACRKYRDWCGRFRTQALIDAYIHRVATENDGCWWRFRDFLAKGVRDRRRPIKELENSYVCKDYYSFWKGGPALLPIPGVRFIVASPFSCEGRDCRLVDKSKAQGWRFRSESLFCVKCWSDQVNTTASRNKLTEVTKSNQNFEGLKHVDCKGRTQRKWFGYVKAKFDVCVDGSTLEDRIVQIRDLRDIVDVIDTEARNS